MGTVVSNKYYDIEKRNNVAQYKKGTFFTPNVICFAALAQSDCAGLLQGTQIDPQPKQKKKRGYYSYTFTHAQG